jgi:hypothetical protein
MYAYIWKFQVKESCISEFEFIYGPRGTWIELFQESIDYQNTELFQDLSHPGRYLTIDYWASKEACESFRRDFEAELRELDDYCERLTDSEEFMGEYSLS